MKTNIAFICLLPKYSKNVSKLLGEKLDMYFVDVEDMLEFELGDVEHILSILGSKEGKKYMRECETRVIKNVVSFENTIITVQPMTMFSNRNFNRIRKTSYIVYLQISPKYWKARAEISGDDIDEKMLGLAFTERDKIYVDSSDIVLNCSTFKEKKTVKKLLFSINKFFRNNETLNA